MVFEGRDGGKSVFSQSPVFGLSSVSRVKNQTESKPFDEFFCQLSEEKKFQIRTKFDRFRGKYQYVMIQGRCLLRGPSPPWFGGRRVPGPHNCW